MYIKCSDVRRPPSAVRGPPSAVRRPRSAVRGPPSAFYPSAFYLHPTPEPSPEQQKREHVVRSIDLSGLISEQRNIAREMLLEESESFACSDTGGRKVRLCLFKIPCHHPIYRIVSSRFHHNENLC